MIGLLDTSVFIGQEQDRPVGKLPDEAAISVLTLAELHLGVLLANEAKVRAQRLRTLSLVERSFDALPIDDAVARTFAEIVAESRRGGRRPRLIDTLIAATGVRHDLPVYSQDADFKEIPGVRVILI